MQRCWNQRCDGEVIGARMCEHGATLRDRRVGNRDTLEINVRRGEECRQKDCWYKVRGRCKDVLVNKRIN